MDKTTEIKVFERGITEQDMHELRAEAGSAGDAELVRIIDEALAGDRESWAVAEAIILGTRAQMEAES